MGSQQRLHVTTPTLKHCLYASMKRQELLLCVQAQGIVMAPGLMHHIGQLSALQALDVHGFEGPLPGYAAHLPPPPLLPLAQCQQLRWLDISHWMVKEPEVGLGTLHAHEQPA